MWGKRERESLNEMAWVAASISDPREPRCLHHRRCSRCFKGRSRKRSQDVQLDPSVPRRREREAADGESIGARSVERVERNIGINHNLNLNLGPKRERRMLFHSYDQRRRRRRMRKSSRNPSQCFHNPLSPLSTDTHSTTSARTRCLPSFGCCTARQLMEMDVRETTSPSSSPGNLMRQS